MKRLVIFVAAYCACIGITDAAVRDASSVNRTSASGVQANATTNVTNARTATSNVIARGTNSITARTARTANSVARTATNARTSVVRDTPGARTTGAATTARTATKSPTTVHSAASVRSAIAPARAARPARAATTISASQSQTFGTGYNACRDAYFTCMDQFCANQNEKYRRCVCSSRLSDIQSRERALSQASNQIQDFKDLNIDAISKTAAEVKAMLTASEGETAAANARDTSASAQKLSGISEVLTNTKSKSLSTAGQLDIAGDINAIWATTDLTSGANIANLTGEALYNAVHSQCVELVSASCTSQSTLNMVISAYGMYIENDCTTLSNALDQKKTLANGTIRETEREMNTARLENYNAHNSTSINDCIAKVRSDITSDTACGKDYVHCLDISGKYLNHENGEPIYTADFYQLETQISLSGDILTNQTNRLIVAELNRKRAFAERGLDTCRDLADEVWDEFMRQAIKEIYQGQQNRIRQVKNECLEVVNKCYDTQSASLKDFSNIKEQMLLGSRLELSEQLCREKLDACSNLYGGGPDGLAELLTTMGHITDQKIAKDCKTALSEYARDMCAVPNTDSLHSYPYACRVYAPGEQKYASIPRCNQELWAQQNSSQSKLPVETPKPSTGPGYTCPAYKTYTKCNSGYIMTYNGMVNETPQPGNQCTKCAMPDCSDIVGPGYTCGDDYVGSLYQKLVRYSMQVCIRPSIAESADAVLPTTVLEDVNMVMDTIRVDMKKSLSTECERLGGYWVDVQWKDEDSDNKHDSTKHTLYQYFYNETGANTKWGYCTNKENDPSVNLPTTPTNPDADKEETPSTP